MGVGLSQPGPGTMQAGLGAVQAPGGPEGKPLAFRLGKEGRWGPAQRG